LDEAAVIADRTTREDLDALILRVDEAIVSSGLDGAVVFEHEVME
jgi:hypothetical protein